MQAERANSHCKIAQLLFSYFMVYFYYVNIFCVSCVLCHFPTLFFECFEPGPSFLSINNKCFKAFCILARYYYVEIC